MRIVLLTILLAASAVGAEYTLPSENQGDWEPSVYVGVSGGFEQYLPGGESERTTLVNVTSSPYNADDTGVSDATSAIASAISAASAGNVIYFPSGTYRVDGPISFTKALTWRGDGRDQTTLVFTTDDQVVVSVSGTNLGGLSSQTITGTKTKGTSSLTVSSSSGYVVGEIVRIIVPEEQNQTRIEAGYPVTWNAIGATPSRRFYALVSDVPSGTAVEIDPPLPYDITPYAATISRWATPLNGVGFESMTIQSDSTTAGDNYTTAINITHLANSWFYDVNFTDFSRSDAEANGQCININDSCRITIQKCGFYATDVGSDDGAIQFVGLTSGLLVDNIFYDFDWAIYDTPPTINTVIAYNFGYRNDAFLSISHGTRYSYTILMEGNIVRNLSGDGYHGGSAYMTMYRNWLRSYNDKTSVASYTTAIRRFCHYYAMVGNVFGWDGFATEANSFGNPNLGNSVYDGTADITAGDPQVDWLISGELITRNSASSGVFTMTGGDPNGSDGLGGQPVTTVVLKWTGGATGDRSGMTVSGSSGSDWTITGGSGTDLPTVSTVAEVWTGQNGFQEQDLAVTSTMTLDHNYHALSSGTGAVENTISPDTLPASLAYSTKPEWFYSLSWPPINPDDPGFDLEAIPAGYRYINGVDPPSTAQVRRSPSRAARTGALPFLP